MKLSTISNLCCPFCSGAVKPYRVKKENDRGIQSGVLQCVRCEFQYPIIGGVLILAPASERIDGFLETDIVKTVFQGPLVSTLCEQILAGKTTESLSLLLNPVYWDANILFRPQKREVAAESTTPANIQRPDVNPKMRFPTKVQRVINRLSGRKVFPATRQRFADFLVTYQQELTAIEVFDLFYGQYSRSEMANYFTFRFGQPRFLAALAIASVMKQQPGPILDLACGAGHLTHYLSTGEQNRMVLGADRDFMRLYIAKNYVAPDADFICVGADQPMPFAEGTLGSVYCSDAFAYFLNKAGCLREMQRVTSAEGVIGISRIGNRTQNPHNGGFVFSADEYSQFLNPLPHVIAGEDELMKAYLNKQAPDLSRREVTDAVRNETMLCIVAAKQERALRDYGQFPAYPHGEGRLSLNPIYQFEKTIPDGIRLRFQFPSAWFAFEDAKYLEYAPELVDVPNTVLAALQAGQRTPAVEDLIARFVVLGLPERYLPAVPMTPSREPAVAIAAGV